MHCDPLSWWLIEFGEIAPIGHALRKTLTTNWTRFHSLPESKRYASSEIEYDELITRSIAVASTLFEEGEQLFIYRSHSYEERLHGKQKYKIAERQLREKVIKLSGSPKAQFHDEDDDYSVRALVATWKPDFYETLIRQVADYIESGISFVSPKTKNIFCPYDGGMDTFSYSISPAQLETKFADWRSSMPSKL